jgi:hypothetical protein
MDFSIHTHLVGLLGWGISSTKGLYRNTGQHNTETRRHTSMPRAGFQSAISMFKMSYTVLALDRLAIETGCHIKRWKCRCAFILNWAPRHESVLGKWRYSSKHSLTSALDGGELSASRPGRFTHRERAPGTHYINRFYFKINSYIWDRTRDILNIIYYYLFLFRSARNIGLRQCLAIRGSCFSFLDTLDIW